MRRFLLLVVVAMMVIGLMAGPALATFKYTDNVIKNAHKVQNKYEISGTFAANNESLDNQGDYKMYGIQWSYEAHVKEAIGPAASAGVVRFSSPTKGEFRGKVDLAETGYWPGSAWGDALFVSGSGSFNGESMYFIALFWDEQVFLATNDIAWDTLDYNDEKSNWDYDERIFQLHNNAGSDAYFDLIQKDIH